MATARFTWASVFAVTTTVTAIIFFHRQMVLIHFCQSHPQCYHMWGGAPCLARSRSRCLSLPTVMWVSCTTLMLLILKLNNSNYSASVVTDRMPAPLLCSPCTSSSCHEPRTQRASCMPVGDSLLTGVNMWETGQHHAHKTKIMVFIFYVCMLGTQMYVIQQALYAQPKRTTVYGICFTKGTPLDFTHKLALLARCE